MANYTSLFTDDRIRHAWIGKEMFLELAFPRLEYLMNVDFRWKAIFIFS